MQVHSDRLSRRGFMRYQKGTSGEDAPSLTWARVPRHCWARRGRLPGLRPAACVFLLRWAPRIEPSALVSGNNGSVVRAVRSIHSPFKAPTGGHGVWVHTFQRASLQVGTRIALGGPLEVSRAWPPDLLSLPKKLSLPVTTFFFSTMAMAMFQRLVLYQSGPRVRMTRIRGPGRSTE